MKKCFDEDLGYMYVCESSVDENFQKMGDIRIYDKNGIFFVDFDAVLQTFGVENRNHRYYLAENVWSAIQTPKIQALLKDNAWYGEQNHPTQEYQDKKLTPERIREPWMPNRSHKIMRPFLDGNMLRGHIQTASGTAAGVGFAKEIIQGLYPRFSCRSIASLKEINRKPTVIIKVLITYDWVYYPSHAEAGLCDKNGHETVVRPILESGSITYEYPMSGVSPEDVMLPLNEIITLVGNKDANTGMILESFDLSLEDIVGFDKTHDHAIIRDKDNTIYAKIRPETKHAVDDFFASFNI